MRKGKNRNKSRKVIAFLRRCPAVCVTPELQDKTVNIAPLGRISVCKNAALSPTVATDYSIPRSFRTLKFPRKR